MPAPKLNKGAAWEYRVHGAAFASGWYVRRNVDLRERIAGSPQTMAEIDLLGVSFDVELRLRRLVGECKDRKGSTKEADRVIWLLGLGELLDADHLLFAKPSIAPATIRFASSTQVALHDESRVAAIEAHLGGRIVAGAFDPAIGQGVIRPAAARDAFGDARLRDAYDWIHNAFWYEPASAKVKRLPGFFRLVLPHADGPTKNLMLIEGVLGLLACGLETAGQLRRHSPMVAKALQIDLLSSGAASAVALRDIAARADEYYRDVVERAVDSVGGERAQLQVPRLVDTIAKPPRWADAYLSFAEQLGSRPQAATDVLRFAELELVERYLAGRDPEHAQSLLIASDRTWLAGAVALAGAFCERVWGLEDPLFAQIRDGPPRRRAPTNVQTSLPLGARSATEVTSSDEALQPVTPPRPKPVA